MTGDAEPGLKDAQRQAAVQWVRQPRSDRSIVERNGPEALVATGDRRTGSLTPVRGDCDSLDRAIRLARAEWPLGLVCMPFVSHYRPSIQVGLLKALTESHGFPAQTLHLNLDFAAQIGARPYEAICDFGRCFVGDWLFSVEAFGDEAPDPSGQLLTDLGEGIAMLVEIAETSEENLRRFRDIEVPLYLERMMATQAWGRFRVVGFTSTFQQSVASIALARRIKQRFPETKVVFGGSNLDGEMGLELLGCAPCIDYAVIGEGDVALSELLITLQAGGDPTTVPGVAARRQDAVIAPQPRPLLRQMDALPAPDYDEYFERAERLGLLSVGPTRRVMIPFESARGCWWGQKHHCSFCGLNGAGMSFRSKSPATVLAELRRATERYRSWSFEAVDNILDMSYLKTFLPRLVEEGAGYKLFYELKANLRRDQIRLLSEAGVSSIQPGIESLSTPVLRLMDKGITAIRNVNTLRWAAYYGVDVAWNILYGFPGERPEHYREQETVMRRIPHLKPPSGIGRIWMERFSPIFADRESFPVEWIRPHRSYACIYPTGTDLDRLAYFFDYEFSERMADEELNETRRILEAWRASAEATVKPSLTFRTAGDYVQIADCRDPDAPGTYTFVGPLATLYTALSDRPGSAGQVAEELGLPWPKAEIEEALDEFCARDLMMRDGNLFLSLGLPAQPGA
jgi:ribosomal peptide maturation radical SAM protein 1